jgi:peptidoglycan/LPS O-acetylase OafA/YrhL
VADQGAGADSLRSFGYLPTVDGLRGLAIVMVLWHHAPHLFVPGYIVEGSFFWWMSSGGWMGVDLFFVISGFLITSILLSSRGQPHQVRDFFIRRGLRILPLYYLYLTLVLAITLVVPSFSNLTREWPYYYLYLANLHIAAAGWPAGFLGILWSLTIEQQFYLGWPWFAKYLSPRRLLLLCLAAVAVTPLIRALVFAWHGQSAVFTFTLCRIDTLLAGAALATALSLPGWRGVALRWCRRLWPLAVLTILATCYGAFGISPPGTSPLYFVLFGYSWIVVACTVILGAALEPGPWTNRLLANRPLVFVGKRCYGFYLWHYLIGNLLHRVIGDGHFLLSTILWAALVTGVATLSWAKFEEPILKLKSRFTAPRLPVAPSGAKFNG